MDDTLRGAPSEGQVTDPRAMREVIVTAPGVIPRRGISAVSASLERALALMAEPPAPLVARGATMALVCGGWRWCGADRRLGNLASPLGQTNALGAILDQAEHLEAQALHGGERLGWRRRRGDGAQDLVFLGAQLQLSFSSVHDRPTQRGGKNARPTGESRAGGSQPVVRFAGAGCEEGWIDLSGRSTRAAAGGCAGS